MAEGQMNEQPLHPRRRRQDPSVNGQLQDPEVRGVDISGDSNYQDSDHTSNTQRALTGRIGSGTALTAAHPSPTRNSDVHDAFQRRSSSSRLHQPGMAAAFSASQETSAPDGSASRNAQPLALPNNQVPSPVLPRSIPLSGIDPSDGPRFSTRRSSHILANPAAQRQDVPQHAPQFFDAQRYPPPAHPYLAPELRLRSRPDPDRATIRCSSRSELQRSEEPHRSTATPPPNPDTTRLLRAFEDRRRSTTMARDAASIIILAPTPPSSRRFQPSSPLARTATAAIPDTTGPILRQSGVFQRPDSPGYQERRRRHRERAAAEEASAFLRSLANGDDLGPTPIDPQLQQRRRRRWERAAAELGPGREDNMMADLELDPLPNGPQAQRRRDHAAPLGNAADALPNRAQVQQHRRLRQPDAVYRRGMNFGGIIASLPIVYIAPSQPSQSIAVTENSPARPTPAQVVLARRQEAMAADCPICCQEDDWTGYEMGCGHIACSVCMVHWLKEGKRCPFCRGKVLHRNVKLIAVKSEGTREEGDADG
ncbi:unnamed protein product [Zymoseptoria tritici ST99CH_3D1]|nr:unnamed protein product [Zymoseptoria tritici ST99CH_3D1]